MDWTECYSRRIVKEINNDPEMIKSLVNCGWVEVRAMKNIFVISMHGTIMAPYEPILIFGRHVPPLAMLITKIR